MDKKQIIFSKSDLELDTDKLKRDLEKLVKKFKDEDGWSRSEEHIQTSFSIELLKLLGWGSAYWILNQGQDVQTGKKPDIILKSSTSKLLVIESKDASKKDKLDGSYQDKTFTEQLFGYCEAEGLYWGILTNFVEWRLYAVTAKRLYKEKKYAFHDLLWPNANKNSYVDLLSEEGLAFLSRLSKRNLFAKNDKIDSDTIYYPQQLDLEQEKIKKQFFEKIKNWRAKLKSWISKNYASQYNADEIDLMAQKILDRMIFMDICHDKGVINENHIQSVLSATKRTKFDELKEKFKLMDEKFNTELFAENEIDKIKINDEVMVEIIKELNDIDFSKLSVHIIGEVYENYLGELAKSRTTDEKKVSDKQKQKKKSQGIFYTPDYIVDYIVKNTVGKILEKAKTVEEVEKIRVLDPACGSGSFLIRAFDEFLSAYMRVHKEGGLFAFELKKKILQKNLFGVDLDAKAVEIAKLNLMIKALEGIKAQDLQGNHLLPNLNLNIRCGNSLIGGEKSNKEEGKLDLDNYQKEINELIDFKNIFNKENDNDKKKELLREIAIKEEYINGKLNTGLRQYFTNLDKVNPFNWRVAFCEIFKNGGFDAVIGNPPWSSKIPNEINNYISNAYFLDVKNLNLFAPFILESVLVTNPNGLMGILIPKVFIKNTSYKIIREKILNEWQLSELIDFGKFPGVASDCICPIISKSKSKRSVMIKKVYEGNLISSHEINQNIFLKNPVYAFSFDITKEKQDLLNKIDEISMKLKETANIKRGIELGQKSNLIKCDNCGIYNELSEKYYTLKSSHHCKNCKKLIKNKKSICISSNSEKDQYKIKCISGKELKRYYINDYYYIPESLNGIDYKKDAFEKERIFIKRIDTRPEGILISQGEELLTFNTVYSVFNIKDYDPKLILGILNSKLMGFYYDLTYNLGMSLTTQITIEYLKELPIVKKTDDGMNKNIIRLIDEMLKLNKTPESREKNKTKIEAVDYEIDQLVYKLYGIDDEKEINIIEGK